MDSQVTLPTPSPPATPPPPPPSAPSSPPPSEASSRLSKIKSKLKDIILFLKNNKKAVLVAVAIVFLFIILILSIFEAAKERFFPSKKEEQATEQTSNQADIQGTISISTNKNEYLLNERIGVMIRADSKGKAIRAFDVLIDYDPEFFELSANRQPILREFMYFYSTIDRRSIQISAVQDAKVAGDQFFEDTALFEFELKPKKAGTTSLTLIRKDNSTHDSNLLTAESKDILSNVYGKEIIIK